MQPLLTREAARALDADATSRLGVPSIELMEHAGRGAFAVLAARFAERLAHVAVVAGAGQNGGDGWVVARCLVQAGRVPRCVLVGERQKVRGDAATNLAALEQLGVVVAQAHEHDLSALDEALAGASLVVDALFGTGLDRPLGGVFLQAVARINQSAAPVVALDLPSGIDADTGAVLGAAVRAQLTVTFAAHKRGLHQHPGAALRGEVVCVGIGVPGPAGAAAGLLENADLRVLVPRRALDVHKGSAGHVLVIAGAPGRTGAALLCGLGALRTGAGLVTLCGRPGARAALDAKVVELMTDELPGPASAAAARAQELARGKDSVVVGPGLGTDPEGVQLSQQLAVELTLPAVLDADALTALGTDLGRLQAAAGPRVLTPHPGEAARMLGCTSAQVQADRYVAALRLSQLSGAVVVLKGAGTIIAQPDGALRVCSRGTPAMAVAGTGDVLSGVIAALLPQLSAFDAASAGVYLHALAGELAARSDRGLLAHELADALPLAFERVRSSD